MFFTQAISADEIIPFYNSAAVETSDSASNTLTPSEVRAFLCGPPPPWPELKMLSGDKTELKSDSAEMRGKDVTIFSGDVVIRRETTQIEADTARYFHATDDIEADGNVQLYTPDIRFTADQGKFNLNRDQAEIHNATYYAKESGSNGKAEQIKRLTPQRLEMYHASYTTCVNKDPEWELKAYKLTLDNETHQGHLTQGVLRFMDVPLFYFPFLRFPIGDNRLSGFLFPLIGSSDTNGTEIILPYYWNIAPNYDATITPWYMRT
ncbi:MAG: LPS export ABC transporter periplasmic protein LptC, partial [Gammaproteobacteria bacterium]|nr:LPS export ABC transporter periplasmic protein LptC [Gammaproteobacteria bacterium]